MKKKQSHSLRSAWIEIQITGKFRSSVTVALLTECVDRNISRHNKLTRKSKSHSLRSAWIEIAYVTKRFCAASKSHSLRSAWIEIAILVYLIAPYKVALLTECVDRNLG